MATLNCPSCHHHGMVWDWNQSHIMPGGFGPPWSGLPTGTWHGSAMLPPYRPEGDMTRRSSLRAPPRHSRRDLTTDDEDDTHRRQNNSPVRSRRGPVSDDSEDEVVSHRGGRRHRRRSSPVSRTASPALSRRSSRKKSLGVEELIARRVKQNEDAFKSGRYDDETMSNRGSRRYNEETMSNRGSRRYDDETLSNRGGRRYDDDTMSNRGGRRHDDDTISNRGGRRHDEERLTIKGGRRQDGDEIMSNRGGRRNDFDDSMSNRSQRFDDDSVSNRGGRHNDFDETTSNRGGRRLSDTSRRRRRSPTQLKKFAPHASSEDSGDEMSDGIRNKSLTLTRQLSSGISNVGAADKDVDTVTPSEVDKPLGPVPIKEWECDHCTFVNQAGSRVCVVCCKTTTFPKYIELVSKPSGTQEVTNDYKPQEDPHLKQTHQNSSTSPLKEFNTSKENKMKEETNLKEDTQMKSLTKQPNSSSDVDLAEKMKNQLAMTQTPVDKKKGKRRRTISFWLGTKLYS